MPATPSSSVSRLGQGPVMGLLTGSAILTALAGELDRLRQLAHRMEFSLGQEGTSRSTVDYSLGRQQMDPLIQGLSCLMDVAGRLASVSPADWTCDPAEITSHLPLEAVARRLRGDADPTDDPSHPTAVEFF